jgi:hypothetical protein
MKRLVSLLASAMIFSAHAAAPMSTTTDSGVYRMQLGDFQVSALSDGTVTLPIDKLLTDVASAVLHNALQHDNLKPMMEISINAYLVNTGGKLVLIDTGAGDSSAARGRVPDGCRNACAMPATRRSRWMRCC